MTPAPTDGLPFILTPDELVRSVKHLPSAPKILPRLKQLLRDGNSALQEIVTLIRLDPGLALRVLQIANSPYFYTGGRCLTVEEAVARVGYEEIYHLVSYAVAAQVLNRPLVVYGIEADELWARSVGCALAAEALALRVGQDPAVAYTIGLLHGIGMIAIDEWSLHSGNSVYLPVADYPVEATVAECHVLGFTHADAGAALLQQWDFPADIVDPIRHQYATSAAAGYTPLAAILVAAKWIRSAVLRPVAAYAPPKPTVGQMGPLRLQPGSLGSFVPVVARRMLEVDSVLAAINDDPVERLDFPSRAWRK